MQLVGRTCTAHLERARHLLGVWHEAEDDRAAAQAQRIARRSSHLGRVAGGGR